LSQEGSKRVAVVAGSLAATGIAFSLAFLIGNWGYNTRRMSIHHARLEHLRDRKPVLDVVVQALGDEGSPLVASPRGAEELARAAERWGGARVAEILEKGKRWPEVRVFVAGDAVYFLYFDVEGVLRDFILVSR
jgi:hypothetical protein